MPGSVSLPCCWGAAECLLRFWATACGWRSTLNHPTHSYGQDAATHLPRSHQYTATHTHTGKTLCGLMHIKTQLKLQALIVAPVFFIYTFLRLSTFRVSCQKLITFALSKLQTSMTKKKWKNIDSVRKIFKENEIIGKYMCIYVYIFQLFHFTKWLEVCFLHQSRCILEINFNWWVLGNRV